MSAAPQPSVCNYGTSEPFENTPFIVTVRGETLLMLQLSGEFEKRTGMQKSFKGVLHTKCLPNRQTASGTA